LKINLLDETDLFETAKDVALKVHPRAADAYFIATAKLTNSVLVTNDRAMANSSRRYGIEAYYLIEDFGEIEKRMRELCR